ncbi:MAG: glycoside hydrolase family 3 C-terminal domain-containing protein [Clostridiales Family XIII bacterium]|jgi:beta-glucosidase|nr:glycoside hydrolase family 3 C-terminal domain-containing protein [Clostridiales Family XIII bacterium]
MDPNTVVDKMTLEEKCALLTGKTHWESRDYPHYALSSLFFADGPHGIRKQLGSSDHLGLNASCPATCFPTSSTVANSWNQELCEEIGAALGREAAAQGVDVLLGPGLNIKRSPLCGRNFEYFSEDPYLSGKMAAAYIRGIQSVGVAACPKHYAVNNQETIRMSSDSVLDQRTLREIYLTGFEIAVKEGAPGAIMSSYNRVNGIYANEHPQLLTDILRDEWGFDGMVVTDWGGSNDHTAGVCAGSTIEMPGCGFDSAIELISAVKDGAIELSVVDARVKELVRESSRKKNAAPVNEREHHNLARKAAEESIVLLKNDGVLPVAKNTAVAVIGDMAVTPRYQGVGSSHVEPFRLENALEWIEKSELTLVGYAKGYERLGKSDEALKREALSLAEAAEIVLVYAGLTEAYEAEGMDRTDLSIPRNQIELIEALCQSGKPVVVVLAAGAVIRMEWSDRCAAVAHGYLHGQAGAEAMVRVLTGIVNPCGKLAETYPFTSEDTPCHHYYPSDRVTAEYREGIYVGYRYYEKTGAKVKYPFGFGLSYTTFRYDDLTVLEDRVTFTITNTGDAAGAEIAQLYIGCEQKSIFRASKELKGFRKIHLQPGETGRVEIPLTDIAFRYYNAVSCRWEIEAGIYHVYVGASSEDIRLSGNISHVGSDAPVPYALDKLSSYYSGEIQSVTDDEFSELLNAAIPEARWADELSENMPLCRMGNAKSFLARSVCKILKQRQRKSMARGKPDLNILFLLNIPFRALSKMTNGMVSKGMTKGILLIVNGHFFKGMGQVIGGYFQNRKANKEYEKLLARQRERELTR